MSATDDALVAAELLEGRVEQARAAANKVREAARELRETLSEVQQARAGLEALEARIAVLVGSSATKLIEKAVEENIGALGRQTEELMGTTSRKVISEFDRLRDMLLGMNTGDGGLTVPQVVSGMEQALKLNWPVFMNAVAAAQATLRGCSTTDCAAESEWSVVAMIELPDGRRGESHFHVCAKHREELKKDPAVTVVKSFRLETRMCPYQHRINYTMPFPEPDSAEDKDGSR